MDAAQPQRIRQLPPPPAVHVCMVPPPLRHGGEHRWNHCFPQPLCVDPPSNIANHDTRWCVVQTQKRAHLQPFYLRHLPTSSSPAFIFLLECPFVPTMFRFQQSPDTNFLATIVCTSPWCVYTCQSSGHEWTRAVMETWLDLTFHGGSLVASLTRGRCKRWKLRTVRTSVSLPVVI